SVDHETSKTNRSGHAKDQRHRPAGAAGAMQHPEIDEHRGRDPEADEIGKRIELRAELAVGAEIARDPAVESIEDRRQHDRGDCAFPVRAKREGKRGGPAAEAEHGKNIRQEMRKAKIAGGDRLSHGGPTHASHQGGKSAKTVSPAFTFCPSLTQTRAPS